MIKYPNYGGILMNDQQENLVRQSKWSGRRVVLLYWFAIVFLGTSAAAGLGTTVFKPNYKIEADHPVIPEPWHADDCATCHSEEVDGWNTTWHSQMVGYYDPADVDLNGSRMSYNDTHYWRTPKSAFMSPNYWTYNQLFNASGQQCCMTTRWYNITTINATTGAVLAFNATLSAEFGGYTSNMWDIGVSCAACHAEPGEFSLSYTVCSSCHTPGGRQWMGYLQSGHYGSLDDLLASGDITSLVNDGFGHYVGQSTYMDIGNLNASDYYGITCVTCHDPHDATVNAADESNAMSPWTNPFTGEMFGPGGSQLRAATVNDLCGTCHDISLNTSTSYFLDPMNHTTLDCTDCHGYTFVPATYFENGTLDEAAEFADLNHNWKFGGGEPGEICGLCHGDANQTVYTTMQDYIANFGDLTDMEAEYATKLAAAMAAYDLAKATDGSDIDKLANAYMLIEEAKELAEGTSLVFHNPELGMTIEQEQLSLALSKLDDALDDATDALPEPEPPTTTTTTEPPEETTTTTTAAPAIGLLAVMGILGFVVLFRRKKR
jgi:hypothetical protein